MTTVQGYIDVLVPAYRGGRITRSNKGAQTMHVTKDLQTTRATSDDMILQAKEARLSATTHQPSFAHRAHCMMEKNAASVK